MTRADLARPAGERPARASRSAGLAMRVVRWTPVVPAPYAAARAEPVLEAELVLETAAG